MRAAVPFHGPFVLYTLFRFLSRERYDQCVQKIFVEIYREVSDANATDERYR